MSFWSGMAKGMEAGLAKKEREAEAERDQANVDSNNERQDRLFFYRQAMDERAEARASRQEQLQKEELAIDRTKSLVTLGLGGSSSSLSTKTSGSGKNTTATTIANNKLKLANRLKDNDFSDPKVKDYWSTVLSDPSASSKLYEFITEQESEGNFLSLGEIPGLIEIAHISKGKGVEAKKLLEAKGVDVNNAEEFMKAISVLGNYVAPSVVLDIQPNAYSPDIEAYGKQNDLFLDYLADVAQKRYTELVEKGAGQSTEDVIEQSEISQALNQMSKGGDVGTSGAAKIKNMFGTMELIDNLQKGDSPAFRNLSENPYLRSITEAYKDIPVFTELEDLEAWRSQGNEGPVILNGRRYLVKQEGN